MKSHIFASLATNSHRLLLLFSIALLLVIPANVFAAPLTLQVEDALTYDGSSTGVDFINAGFVGGEAVHLLVTIDSGATDDNSNVGDAHWQDATGTFEFIGQTSSASELVDGNIEFRMRGFSGGTQLEFKNFAVASNGFEIPDSTKLQLGRATTPFLTNNDDLAGSISELIGQTVTMSSTSSSMSVNNPGGGTTTFSPIGSTITFTSGASASGTPEPSTFVLAVLSLVGLATTRRRRRR